MRVGLLATCVALIVQLRRSPAMAQQVRVGFGAAGTSMDPHFHALTPNVAVRRHVFGALVGLDEKLGLKPELAESWRAVESTIREFKLRKGVKFQDGFEFTAEDVVFSVERVATVPTTDVDGLGQDANVAVFSTPGVRNIYLYLDQRRDQTPGVNDAEGKLLGRNLLKDLRVRRALSVAIDRDAIVDRDHRQCEGLGDGEPLRLLQSSGRPAAGRGAVDARSRDARPALSPCHAPGDRGCRDHPAAPPGEYLGDAQGIHLQCAQRRTHDGDGVAAVEVKVRQPSFV